MKFIIFSMILFPALIFAQQKQYQSFHHLKSNLISDNIKMSTQSAEINMISSTEKKSAGLGILYSLLLPGMGELYADSYNVGMYFTIADGLLWGTLIGMNSYSNWQKENYKSYAASIAGIDNSGKDDNYYAVIGEYSNIQNYNDEKALERNFDEMYDEESYFWKWSTQEERRTYRDMWTSSEQTSNDLRFVIGGLILNRVISAINAARLVASYNNNLEEQIGWNVSVGFENYMNLPSNLSLRFVKSF